MTLDVIVSANPLFETASTDGTTWTSFDILVEDSFYGGLRGTFSSGGGPITISPTGGAITTRRIAIDPIEGTLVKGDSPQPFVFFTDTPASPNMLIWGSIEPITIDGPVVLDATASSDAVLHGIWGANEVLLPITKVVPEPSSQFLLIFGTLGLLTLAQKMRLSPARLDPHHSVPKRNRQLIVRMDFLALWHWPSTNRM